MYTAPSSTLTAVAGTTAATAATATQLDTTTTASTVGSAVQPLMGPPSAVGGSVHALTDSAVTVAGARPTGSGSVLASGVHTLPFTGVNIFFMILSAITMLLMGLALIRMGRTLTTREATI